MVTRREFLAMIGASYAASASCVVSGFSRTVDDAPSLHFGYAAITWGNAVTEAMDDIAAVGFRGIQLRGEAFAQYGDRPAELRAALVQHRLTFAALSSGNLSIDPAREREELATHVRHAQFVKDTGGMYLQVIDERPKGRAIVAEDYRRLGRLMTELGKRTADIGVPLVYHHHMNSLGEKPGEVDAVLDAADKKYVRVLFDVAHYQQAAATRSPRCGNTATGSTCCT
jgi:inosose dehydratase